MLIVVVSGAIVDMESEDVKVQTPTGTINLGAVVSPAKMNSFFINNRSYWSKCDAYEAKIQDREDGFTLQKYKRYPIVNLTDDHSSKHKIYQLSDGKYEMKVSVTCEFKATVKVSLFGYTEEKLEFDGGNVYFNMDIYQNEGRYHLVSMKAYKHSRD